MIFGNLVIPWTQTIRSGPSLARRAFDAANRLGDLTLAGYSSNNLITNILASGDSLVGCPAFAAERKGDRWAERFIPRIPVWRRPGAIADGLSDTRGLRFRREALNRRLVEETARMAHTLHRSSIVRIAAAGTHSKERMLA